MGKKLTDEQRRALEDALERHSKAVESNMKLLRSAVWAERLPEAEKWRRHAFEAFQELAEIMGELNG